MRRRKKRSVNHAATSLSWHAFIRAHVQCLFVVSHEYSMHTCAFNALMANNDVLIHLHFFVIRFGSIRCVFCLACIISYICESCVCVCVCFFFILSSCCIYTLCSSFERNEAMGEQTYTVNVYVRNECVLTSGAFDVNAHDQY